MSIDVQICVWFRATVLCVRVQGIFVLYIPRETIEHTWKKDIFVKFEGNWKIIRSDRILFCDKKENTCEDGILIFWFFSDDYLSSCSLVEKTNFWE